MRHQAHALAPRLRRARETTSSGVARCAKAVSGARDGWSGGERRRSAFRRFSVGHASIFIRFRIFFAILPDSSLTVLLVFKKRRFGSQIPSNDIAGKIRDRLSDFDVTCATSPTRPRADLTSVAQLRSSELTHDASACPLSPCPPRRPWSRPLRPAEARDSQARLAPCPCAARACAPPPPRRRRPRTPPRPRPGCVYGPCFHSIIRRAR